MSKWCFVIPRVGESIGGGAETLSLMLAKKLHERGDEVLIVATTAKDNRTWANEFPEGSSQVMGVPVCRFKVDVRDTEKWIPRQIQLSEGMQLSLDAELEWMENGVNSSEMYTWLRANKDAYDAFFFAPYLFGTTFFGSLAVSEKAFLIPCLHDEHYAYTQSIASMFRQVRGCLFNAKAEAELARRLYGPLLGGVIGMGFDAMESSKNTYFKEGFSYLLYLGRKETGKGAQRALDYFVEAKDAGKLPSELKFVICGSGSFSDLERPTLGERSDIIDIHHVSESEKKDLLSKAVALVQPSRNESFSIVLMEAWLQGTPVLVDSQCAVTKDHVMDSGGGLYFSNATDFYAAASELLSNKELANTLGEAGRSYVINTYSWESVLRRFDAVLSSVLETGIHAQAANV